MNKLAKAAIVFSSLTIAGTLVAYQGGLLQFVKTGYSQAPQTKAPAAQTATAPAQLLSGSKSFTSPVPGTPGVPGVIAPASNVSATSPVKAEPIAPNTMLSGSKSLFLVPRPETPATTSTAPSTATKPAATATAPAVFIGGSKSSVPLVNPPAKGESK